MKTFTKKLSRAFYGIALLCLFNTNLKAQGSFNFDGFTANYIQAPSMNFGTNWTVEAWARPTYTTAGWYAIVSQTYWDGNQGFVIAIYNGTVFVNSPQGVLIETGIDANVWTHVAVSYNNGIYAFYKNGTLVGTQVVPFTNSSNPFIIGGRTNNNNVGFAFNYFEGDIDEVRVWNVTRTQYQIMEAMNYQIPGAMANLVANYHFNQGTPGGNNGGINYLTDASGNNLTGSLNGMALSGTEKNWVGTSPSLFGFPTVPATTEVNVIGNGVSIANGSSPSSLGNHTNFGSTYARTFTVTNTGTPGTLNVGKPVFSGVNGTEFTVTVPPAPLLVPSVGTTSFVAAFSPTSVGAKAATLYMYNSDQDESFYNFALTATAVAAAALHFDGVDDYVEVGANLAEMGKADFTIEAWIKTTGVSQGIVNYADNDATWEIGEKCFYLDASGRPTFVGFGNGYIPSTVAVNNGAWHHVAVVWDYLGNGTGGTGKIYIDGVDQTGTVSYAALNNNASGGIKFGRPNFQAGEATGYFSGEMDEVRIYDRALCLPEVLNNMSCEIPSPNSYRDLNGYYRFNNAVAFGGNAANTTVTDNALFGNHGTLTNFALSGMTSNWTSPGGVTSGANCAVYAYNEINVLGNGNDIPINDITPASTDHTDFGSIGLGGGVITRTFTIQNAGTQLLTLSSYSLSGANATSFTITNGPPASLGAASSTILTISFSATTLGAKNAVVNIASNDCDESPFTFAITASVSPVGEALAFDGAGDYVEMPDPNLGSSDCTIEGWFYQNGAAGAGHMVTTRTGQAGGAGNWWIIHAGSGGGGGKLFWELGAAGGNYSVVASPDNAYALNTWNHFAVVRSGFQINLYLNGVLVANATETVTRVFTTTDLLMRFGGWPNFNAGWFNGSLDEIRVWNVARTQYEIQSYMNCEFTTTPANLLANYHFTQGAAGLPNPTVNRLTDASASVRTGTLLNFSLSGTASNWVSGGGVTTGSTTSNPPTAEIEVRGNGAVIADGTTARLVSNFTNFNGAYTRTFVVHNTAGGTLNFAPYLTGADAKQFTVTTIPASSVGAASSLGFVVTFTPTTAGTKTAQVNIINNDLNEPVYDFVIEATPVPASALSFDGATEYIAVNGLTFTSTPFTVEFWAKRNSDGTIDRVLSQGGTTTDGGLSMGFAASPSDVFRFGFFNDDLTVSGYNDFAWHHWACVYDPSQGGKNRQLYRDGVLIANDRPAGIYTGTGVVNIGTSVWAQASTDVFDGSIDELRVWNVARSHCDIQRYMNCEIAGAVTGLVANYHFNQGAELVANPTETVLIDDAGSHTGTLTGFALTGTVSNWSNPGGVTSGSVTPATVSATLNVRGNGVTIPNNSMAPNTGNFTDFGAATTRTFVLENPGTTPLYIDYGYFTGASASNFGFASISSTLIPASGSGSIVISFTPTATGSQSAILNILTSDCSYPTYSFALTASTSPASALNFDDVNDQIVNIPNVVLNNQSFTVEFWAKRAANSGNDLIVSQGVGNPNIGLHTGFLGTNFVFAFWANDLVVPFTDLSWHHWACVYKAATAGTDRFVYRDGQLVGSDNSPSNYLGTGTVAIGSWGGGDLFGGDLDEVRIWNVARTQCEIQNYMNCEIPTTAANLLVNFHFNQGVPAGANASYTTAIDAAGGNNGSLSGFALSGPTSNWIDPGAIVSGFTTASTPSLTVKGNNVVIPNNSMAPNSGNFTDFGAATTRTFVIENPGTGTLYINSSIFSGANATNFSITTAASTLIAASGTSSFVISFTPTAAGSQSAILTLNSSDCSTPAYSFAITASTTPAEALNFNATTDQVRISYVQPQTNITNEFWFKTTNANQGLFSVTDNPASVTGWDRNIFMSGGDIRSYVWMGGPTETISTTGTNFADGNWHHVAEVISAAGHKLYVDGILRASGTATASSFNTNTHIILGYAPISVNHFNGTMDEVRIWTVARSQCEILSYMNCEIPTTATGLALNYHFSQGLPSGVNTAVTTLTNATGGASGALNTFALTGATSNWVSPGSVITGSITPATLTPTLNVRGNGVLIANNSTSPNAGDFTDFGLLTNRTFVLHNISSGSLYIGNITFSGASASNFSVTTPPSTVITGVGSSNFVISFTPTAAGSQSAIVIVNSSDCTSPNYSFVITASTVPASALNIDINDYVQLPMGASVPTGNSPYTIEARIRPDVHAQNMIVGWGPFAVNQCNFLRLGTGNTVQNYWWYNDLTVTVPNLADGNWHHVAATFDGTYRKIYVDGVMYGKDMPTGHNVVNTANFCIGKGDPTGGANEWFDGTMDDIRIWDIARTQCELQTYKDCEIPGSPANLVANFHFNQGVPSGSNTTQTLLFDSSPSNITGTLTSFALTPGAVSNWVSPAGVIANGYTVMSAPLASLVLNGNGNNIPVGAATSTTNLTDFGTSATRAFVLQNPGSQPLYINYGTLTGANASSFSVTTIPSTMIPAGGTSNAVISFTPTSLSSQSAIVTINSSDCTYPNYSFVITASTTPAEALAFSGAGEYVEIPVMSPGSNKLTFETWIQPTNITANQHHHIMRQDVSISVPIWLVAFQDYGTHLTFGVNTSSGYSELDAPINPAYFTDGYWHHIAAVYDGANRRIFVDGVQLAVDTKTGNIITGGMQHSLGRAPYYGEFYKGRMDETRYWNVARSQCEIQSYMNCEIPGSMPGLVANYHFNQGIPSGPNATVTALTDAAGANTGTLNTFVLTGSVSNWVSPGGVTSGSIVPSIPTASILVSGNSNSIIHGSTSTSTLNFTDFAGVSTRTFVIQNSATGTLNITAPYFTGVNASEFSVSVLPSLSLAASATTSFVVAFTPTTGGFRTATLNINNNDCNIPIFSCAVGGTPAAAAALDLDGVDDIITLPSINLNGQSFTLEFWTKRAFTGVDGFVIGQGTPGPNTGLHVGFRDVDHFTFAFYSNDLELLSPLVNDLQLHHWACVYDRTAIGKNRFIYCDGVLVASDLSPSDFLGTGPMFIGQSGFTTPTTKGLIDEVRIWGTARTQCQIQTFMNCEIPSTAPGLIANYHFNQGAAGLANPTQSLLIDAAGVNTGTLSAFSLTGATSNWVSPGGVISGSVTPAPPTGTLTLAGNGNNIPQGTSTSTNNFTDFGTATSRTFVITNPGASPLYVNGGAFSGANASNFSITTAPSTLVAGSNGSSNFVITFTPTSVGSQSAIVTLKSSDCTSPNYSFVITASTAPASALSFDGSNDDIIIPANPVFDFPVGTIEAWININSAGSNGCIASMRNSSTTRWSLHANVAAGNITMYNGSTVGSVNVPLSTNTWYHVAVILTPTTMVVYLNGIYAGKSNVGLNTGNTGHSLNIGTTNDGASTFEHFNGRMDEVRFWNVARTQCEIQQYMNCEIPTVAPGLFANYHFNQGIPSGSNPTVTVLTDATGSYNANLNTFALNGNTSNWVAPGPFANGYTTAIAPTGTLTLAGNGNNVPQGTATSTNNFTDFGSATSRTFVISNPGAGPLYVTSGSFSGVDASNFSLTTLPSTLIAGSGSSNFVITFTPTAVGSQSAILTINSSDCSSPNYSFVITASTSPASALAFDGTNDQVTVSGLSLNNQPFTIEFWAKRNSSSTADMVFSHGTNSPNNGLLIGFRNSGNNFHFSYWTNDFDIPGVVDLNWHHWACVLDPSSGIYQRRIYKDGILIGTNNAGVPYTGTGNATIGNTSWTPLIDPLDGSVDELRVWNTVRSQCEIETYMNCEIPTTAPNLLANYHFNQGIPSGSNTAVTTLTNATGGSNGTLGGFSLLPGNSTSNWVDPGGVISGSITPNPPTASLTVSGNSNLITPGATLTSTLNFTDFGTASTRTFVIQNTAAGILNISTPSITGAHSSEFSVTVIPSLSLAASATTSFVVAFTPTTGGTRTATMSIFSNDCSIPLFSCAISGQAPDAEALSFNGLSTNTASRTIVSNLTTSVTLQAKVYWYGNTPSNQMIVYNGNSSTSGYGIYNSIGGIVQVLYGGVLFTSFNYTLTPQVWTDLAMVLRSGRVECYVNGVLTNVTAVTNPNAPSTGVGPVFAVGSNQVGAEVFNGRVDEVRFWDKALSQCDIQSYKDCEIPGAMPNLLANFHFNQGAAGLSNLAVITATDASGNNNHLTLSNFALTGTLSNWVSPGGVVSGYTVVTPPSASVNVTGNGNPVLNGSTSTSTNNFTDFGTATTRTFVIQNGPAGTLNLGIPYFTGLNASEFSVSVLPSASLAASASTSLVISFAPTTGGFKTATLNINSNDCNIPIFSCAMGGTPTPGAALSFNGSTDYISTTLDLDNDVMPVTTWEAWVYPTANDNVYRQILSIDDCCSDRFLGMRSGDFVIGLGTFGNWTPVSMDMNQWQHVALVHQGNQVRFYKNGIEYSNTTNFAFGMSNYSLTIGRRPDISAEHYQGYLDELRIWSTARSQCEIQTYMSCEIPATAAGLLANYHFNQGGAGLNNSTVTTLSDAASVNTGNLNGFALTGTVSNWIAPGPFTSGYTVTAQPSSSLSITGNGNPVAYGSTATGTNNFTDFDTNPSRTFVLSNSPTGTLYINTVTFTGANAAQFSVSAVPASSLSGSGNINLTIAYTPTAPGSGSAVVHIGSSDCTYPTYSFVITASASPASALNFDGGNDKVTIPSGISLNNQPFTVEFWARRTGTGNNMVVGLGASSTPNNALHIGFRTAPGNGFTFAFYSNDINYTTTASTDLQYHHWACVYDHTVTSGSNRFVYLDGELVFHDRSNSPFTGTGPLIIGDAGYGSNPYQGDLDELRIWNVARSQCEIQTYMNCEIPGTAPGLAGNFHFNQGLPSGINTAVTTLTNDAGASNGNLTGFGLNTSTSNWVAPAHLANGFTTTATPNLTVTLSGNGNPIANNPSAALTTTLNHTDFGASFTRTFVIQNSGTNVLSSVNLQITGPDAGVFSVTTLPAATVGIGGTTSFVVAFTPTLLGAHAATINLATNDCSNPVFSYAVTATVTSASALDFDGTNDRVEIANSSALDNIITGNFSFEAWVKPTNGQLNTIISKGHGGGLPGSGEYIFQLSVSNQLSFFHTSMNGWKYGSGTVPLNAWSHVAVTYDGTHLKFYINGLLDATVPSSVGINTPGNNPVYIGSQGFNCQCNRFQGTIDEVRVWTVPRTQCELITYMNCEIPGTPSGLLANYHFNSGIPSGSNASYSLAVDGSGVNTGTLVSMALSGNTSNWISPGGVVSGSTTPAIPGATLIVTGNSQTITAGSMSPQLINFTDFGTASTRTFVLHNTGTGTLHIGNGLFSGANASNFVISTLPSNTLLSASASTSFVITFTPTSVSTHSAVLTIYSSDCASPEYSFAITASVVPASALNFDGTASYVDLGPANTLKPGSALTAEAWVYSSNWPSQDQTIFGNTENAGYGLFTRTTGNLEGLVRRNSTWGAVTTPLSGISTGWHHVAMTYDGRYTRLYVDGVMKSEDDAGATYPIDYIGNNTLVGGEASSGSAPLPGWYFNGSVDELRIWSAARTQCEILTYKDCEIPGTPASLVANYHFNQGIPSGSNTSVTSLIDGMGVHTGTLNLFNLSGGSVANWISPGGVVSDYTTTSVPSASISVTGNGNPVLHGSTSTSTTNFTYFDTNPSRTFVIQNSPSGTLYINTLSFSGANAAQFSVSTAPSSSLAGNGSSNFTILFTPTSVGISSAVVHVNSSDCSTPGYSFVITASTTAASALNFDGASAYIDLGAGSNLKPTSALTAEAWVYRTAWSNTDQAFISNTENNGYGLLTRLATGNLEAYLRRNNTWAVVGTPLAAISPGWHHVAMTYDGRYTRLFLDGVMKGEDDAGAVYPVNYHPSNSTLIGAEASTGSSPESGWYLNGSVDEVRIWNTARTQCELLSYKDCEIPSSAVGLVASYHFNQGIPSGPNMAVTSLTQAISVDTGTLNGFSLTGGPVSNWISPGAIVSGFTTAVAPAASLSVTGNSNPIAHGSTATSTNNFTDFGSVSTRTFVIQNTGPAALYVNTVTLSGPDATSFSVTSAPSASIGTGSTSFAVLFGPSSLGTKTAIVSLNSSDCSAPDYSFVITATAVAASAMAFDGVDDYIDLGTSPSLKPASALTQEAWVYLPNWVGSAQTFMGTAQTAGYTLRTNGTELRGFVYVNSGFLVAGTPLSTITPGWHHTAFTYDGRYAKLYLDGVLMDTRDAGAVYPITYTGNNMILGAEAGPGATPVGGYMGGRLDEVRIWDRALCQAEIQNSMNCEIAATGNGLIANYHFNEGIAYGANATTTVVPDASGNALNGTVMNAQMSGTTSNWVNPGAVNSGSVCGPFVAPEVSINSGTVFIPDGAAVPTATNNTDFGNISVSANIVRTYTIQNSGIANLSITSITLTGADASSFTVSALSPASPIPAGNAAVFSVTFAPSTAGTKSAVVTVNNSDCDESAYDFVIQGNATAGEAFVMDGASGNYIKCGNFLTASYTKEAWVKIGPSTNGNNFISTGTGVTGSAFWAPGLASYNYSLSAGHDGNWKQVQDNVALNFGVWYHVAVTYDAPTTTMMLYRNGNLVATNTGVAPFTGNTPLEIGSFAGTFNLNGSIDEVRIWNRPLCQSEIVNNMNCEIATTASGLIANYHFNQGVAYGANATNSLVTDASGAAHTGTLLSSALSGTASNWQSPGAVTTGSFCPPITVPEIDLSGNNNPITDGSTLALISNHTDFGGVCSNTIMVRTYTIQNNGTANLNITNITMSGANSAQFIPGTLSPASPIAPGNTAVFSVTFAPASTGVKSATLNISNDDCSEGTYDVALTGTCNALPVVGITVSNSVICEGFSTTLNGTGATTYTWTGGTPTVTDGIAFTPTITQSYTVTGTEALTGCTSTNLAVQSITVNPTPTITASSSSLVFCDGNSATITAGGAGTYTLDPGALPFNTNTISVSPNLTTSYSVTGTSTNNCAGINTVVITITVNALPTVTASASNSLICNTATTSLIGSGAGTYTWTGSAGAPTVTNGTPFSPTTTLTYTLSGSDALTGCTSTNVAAQTISVNPTPTVGATAVNSVICEGETATLTASGADTYTWNPGPLMGATITPMTATLTTYTVTGTSLAGCTSTNLAVQTISVNTLPTVTAAISQSVICAGNSITVNGSGADTYTWTGGATDGTAFAPVNSGSFVVSGTSNLTGCTSTNVATVSVTVNAPPSLSITITNPVICNGGESSLSGSGATTYTWSEGISDNVLFSPTITTTYTLTATDVNSCTNTAVATITVNNLPTLTVTGTPSLSCEAESTTLTVSGASSYTWSSGEISNTLVITPTLSTSYTITAMDVNTCTNTVNYTHSVTPCPGTFTASADVTEISCRGKRDGVIKVNALTSYTNSQIDYRWDPPSLCPGNNCDSIADLRPGIYGVTVKITYTLNGTLVKSDSLALPVMTLQEATEDCAIKIYNGVTANSDGTNDVFTIENIDKFPTNKVTIFNRWGQQVFEASGYNNRDKAWPLKDELNNLTSNTYFYIIDLGNGTKLMKGWLELVKE